MSRRPPLVDLEATLGQLVPTLARLSELLVLQRQAVADGDLDRLLALTTDQEAASARLAALEAHRDQLQTALERELGVQGLHAIAQADSAAHPRSALPGLVDSLRFEVVRLHEENRRAAELLAAATEMAGRTRAFLAHLLGADLIYPAIAGGAGRMDG
ncbi:MAG TPA: flagellar export chaperone FlgN [Chloroflexota bacterium]|nr:flagellar export chaperone FlgN [Chloroflexota bacterium]